MTIPITRSVPRIRLSDAALADLQLYLGGVRLPWDVLGGTAARQSEMGPRHPHPVGVVVGDNIDVPAADHSRLLLLDRQNAPVAALVGSPTIHAGPAGTVAHGDLEVLTSTSPLAGTGDQDLAGALVIVAMRPWLTADTAMLGLDRSAEGQAPRHVVVLVPSESASPDGVPATTMRRCIDRAVAELPGGGLAGVELRSFPLVWRDPDSDRALALAVAETWPESRTIVLEPDDASWRTVLDALDAGAPLPPAALADGAAGVLLQWRPPPEQRGLVVMFTGLSGSGKSTLAAALVAWLEANSDRTVTLLDGDVVRQHLSSELGFDLSSRDLNIRRIGYVAGEIARHHGIAVCAPIAPFDASRKAARTLVEQLGDFVLIHVATPLAECERRDRKGLYARARAGLVREFTGISSPYEVPLDANLSIDTSRPTVSQSLAQVLDLLRAGHWLAPGPS